MTKYSAIILAGGRSSRMGQKKASMHFRGKTFIEIILDKIRETDIREIMISGYDYKKDQYIYVEDIFNNKGPLAGIHSGLIKSSAQSVLVLTEDAPLVPVWFMKKLMEEHDKKRTPVTVASCDGRIQPLLGIYDKHLASLCEDILKGEKSAVRILLDKTGFTEVPYPGNEMEIRGCNTPEEYEKLNLYEEGMIDK